MCIRDRLRAVRHRLGLRRGNRPHRHPPRAKTLHAPRLRTCLLYTSDAADERSSVDLGGRRIIKKKNTDDVERANWRVDSTRLYSSAEHLEQ